MPRTKKSARRGNSRSASHSNGRGDHLETSFVPFAGTSSPKRSHNGFTLKEEAHNTERHHSFWDSDQKLRHTKVNFVSAGRLESSEAKSKDLEATAALAHMSLDSPGLGDMNAEEEYEELEDSEPGRNAANKDSTDQEPPQSPHHFLIDTCGTEGVDTGLPPPLLRAVSPTPSNSSEEVLLFRGRDRNGKDPVRNPKIFEPSADPIDARIKLVEDKIHEQEHLLEEVLHNKDESPNPSKIFASSGKLSDNKPSRYQCRQSRRGKRRAEQADEDALLADYIANIDEDMLRSNNYSQRELGGTDDDLWQDQETSSNDPLQSRKRAFQNGWTPSDVGDFDDLSTSDGVMGEVQAILSKREREIGSQYLVVWEDQTVDGARWVPASTLTSVGAMSHIELFEAEAKLVAELKGNEEDLRDSDDIDVDDDMDEDDEDDLLQRKIDRMTDEKIVRLLAKQEELGMGSNELFLFDDTADADEDEEAALPKSKFRSILVSPKSRPKGRGARRPRGDFPAAHALADAYDGFDVLDFDRPSLKKKPKGRKGKLAFDLSDSELEASMQMAWDNDRIKKKERRQEREELRAQGLLGNKSGKPDFKEKYKDGIGVHTVKDEIKNFLMGSNTTLALPPMDKADRKVVHELANAFNLKSKSAGGGNKRFPVLYRTSRTSVYTEGTFNAVEARLTRRYLPRMDINGKRSGVASKRGGRGGGGINNAAFSYRDGDIVGGSAPELGVENRGRAMLEKMGWSSGTALGALNNKGILQPVSHIVKTTKAGLG